MRLDIAVSKNDHRSHMSQSIRVHLRIPGTAPMSQLVRLIQDVEAAGFDGAGILDSQLLSRDAFVVLGQAASHVPATLFPAGTQPVHARRLCRPQRHPDG